MTHRLPPSSPRPTGNEHSGPDDSGPNGSSPDGSGPGHLHRGLQPRHIQMIAIGGTIGVGLFLGSAEALHDAGPGLLLTYAVAGVVVFFVMRALGELLVYRPVSGSFATYAEEFIGNWAGFATGWSYWLMWVVTGTAELTAAGIYVQYWWPEVPQWLPGLIALAILGVANLAAVRLFGEFEFWFALIKVLTIIVLLVMAAAILIFGFGPLGESASLSNIWSHGGFFPHGMAGPLLALQVVVFAFVGVELLGVTAGESKDPDKTLPSAVRRVIWRIALFYLGALAAVMALVPWNQLDPHVSPFVLVFAKVGIPAAAGVVNMVVLTAALSSCNSGVFSTGRMLLTLARDRHAPAAFGKVSRQGVPAAGILPSMAVMLLGVAANYFVPEEAFAYVTSVATVAAVFTWGMIACAHLRYRAAVRAGRLRPVAFRMPLAPVSNYFVLAFLGLVLVLLAFDTESRIALYVAPVWAAMLVAGYFLTRHRRAAGPQDAPPDEEIAEPSRSR
ncbi:amino acid permease [Streptomyces sp. NEAU-L66]|uniref:amino acid permease n=1 Tax=Streptomyces sp. NEAU-L66 TaxID=3390812 RepID=UPI0039C71746